MLCLQEPEGSVSDGSRPGSKRVRGGGGAQVVLLNDRASWAVFWAGGIY